MGSTSPLPLWAGRSLALVGILLVALNLRTAVAAISPITGHIGEDIALSSVGLGVLGALPPIAFAVSGFVAPVIAKRIGLELAITLATVAMVAGDLARAFAGSFVQLMLGSVLALAGMGFGNILLPPAVKRYFPDRIGLVTTAYVTLLSISTAVPAVLAAPVADAAGWRVSLGVWSVLAFSSLVPWIFLLLNNRKKRLAADPMGNDAVDEPEAALFRRMLRSRTAWAIALAMAVSSLNAYATFAWFPELLTDIAGVDRIGAGALLAIYGIMGLPTGLLVPVLAARMRNVGLLVQLGVLFFVSAYLGLLFIPTYATWLWVVLAGLGPILFPVCLVLINLRTRSHHTSIALSGFVQSIGYTVGATGPFIVGILHDVTTGWTVPLIFLLGTALVAAISGFMLVKPRFVEDELRAA